MNDSTHCAPCPATLVAEDGISCHTCPVATQAAADQSACEGCPAGLYSQTGVCRTCPSGSEAAPGQHGCLLCNRGTYSTTGDCEFCPAARVPDGSEYGSTYCDVCEAGQYASSSTYQCESCPTRLFSLGGVAECSNCLSGRHVNLEHTGCDACPTGQAGYNGYCNPCSPGTEPNDYQFAMFCIACTRFGPAFVSPGGMPCTECAPGQRPNSLRSGCIDCEPGLYSPNGTADSITGDCFRCEFVRPNAYSQGGATHCSSCAEGYAPRTGQVGCTACSTGRYSSDGAACLTCAPGGVPDHPDHWLEHGTGVRTRGTSCETCPASTFTSALSTVDPNFVCPTCSTGRFSYAGWDSCQSCGDAKQPNVEQTACEQCPTDQQGRGGSCDACPAGSQTNGAQTDCTLCADIELGLHSASGEACHVCSSGKQPDAARTVCVGCVPGFYSPHGIVCLACEDVSAISHSSAANATDCDGCSSGSEPLSDRSGCIDCSLGLVSSDGVACVGCGVVGDVPNALVRAEFCETCQAGRYANQSTFLCTNCSAGERVLGVWKRDFEVPLTRLEIISGRRNRSWIIFRETEYSYAGWDSCQQCGDARQPNVEQTACEHCPVGHAGISGRCALCAGGEPRDNQRVCVLCGDLGPGYYRRLDQERCYECRPGFRPNQNRSDCDQCTPGFFSPNGTGCFRCEDVSAIAHSGVAASYCLGCTPGEEPRPDRSGCSFCGPGMFSSDGVACLDCGVVGDVPSALERATYCETCQATRYANQSTYLCTNCSAGRYAYSGWDACRPCTDMPGFFGQNGVCHRCLAGSMPDNRTVRCEECGIGEAGTDGFCNACPKGTAPTSDRSSCAPCPDQHYSDGSECHLCWNNSIPNQNASSCVCIHGFESGFTSESGSSSWVVSPGPSESCVDIDECAIQNGGCASVTVCTNTIAGFACGNCPPGYIGPQAWDEFQMLQNGTYCIAPELEMSSDGTEAMLVPAVELSLNMTNMMAEQPENATRFLHNLQRELSDILGGADVSIRYKPEAAGDSRRRLAGSVTDGSDESGSASEFGFPSWGVSSGSSSWQDASSAPDEPQEEPAEPEEPEPKPEPEPEPEPELEFFVKQNFSASWAGSANGNSPSIPLLAVNKTTARNVSVFVITGKVVFPIDAVPQGAALVAFVANFAGELAAMLPGVEADDITVGSVSQGSIVVAYSIRVESNSVTAAVTSLAALAAEPDRLIVSGVAAAAFTEPAVDRAEDEEEDVPDPNYVPPNSTITLMVLSTPVHHHVERLRRLLRDTGSALFLGSSFSKFLSTGQVLGPADISWVCPHENMRFTETNTCKFCPAGTELIRAANICTDCANGWISAVGGACTRCAPGQISINNTGCVSCTPGNEPDSQHLRCDACHSYRGWYSDDGIACKMCPNRTRPNLVMGASHCSACWLDGNVFFESACDTLVRYIVPKCLLGEQPTAGLQGCESCAVAGPGYFSDNGRRCAKCPAGTEPVPDLSACVECSQGKMSVDGVECVLCAVDAEPQHTNASSACVSCNGTAWSGGDQCMQCPTNLVVAEYTWSAGVWLDPPPSGREEDCGCEHNTYDRLKLGQLNCFVDGLHDDPLGRERLNLPQRRSHGATCVPCPDCLDCAYGTARLRAGFHNAGELEANHSSYNVYRCPFPAACRNGHCAAGYTGLLCGECAEGFAIAGPLSGGGCRSCAGVWAPVGLLLFLVMMVLLILVAFSLFKASRFSHKGRLYWFAEVMWARTRLILLLTIGHYQVASKIPALFEVQLPDAVSPLFTTLDLLTNLELSMLPSWPCYFTGGSYYRELLIRATLPAGLIALVFLAYISDRRDIYNRVGCEETLHFRCCLSVCLYLLKCGRFPNRALGVRGKATGKMMVAASKSMHAGAAFAMLFWTHSSTVLCISKIFGCRALDNGLSVLQANYHHLCTQHGGGLDPAYATMYTNALILLGVYIVLLPLLMAAALRRKRAAIRAGRHSAWLRPLYTAFRPRQLYWAVMLLLEQSGLGAAAYLARGGRLGRMAVPAGVLVTTVAAVGFVRPFRAPELNVATIGSRGVLWAIFSLCAMLATEAEEGRYYPTAAGVGGPPEFQLPDTPGLHGVLAAVQLLPLLACAGVCARQARLAWGASAGVRRALPF